MNERQDQIMAEITALKMLLRDTDYEVTKYAEGLTACTTQKEIQAYRAEFMAEHGEVIESRRVWRARINELEEELDGLTPVDPVAESTPADTTEEPTDAEPGADTTEEPTDAEPGADTTEEPTDAKPGADAAEEPADAKPGADAAEEPAATDEP